MHLRFTGVNWVLSKKPQTIKHAIEGKQEISHFESLIEVEKRHPEWSGVFDLHEMLTNEEYRQLNTYH